MTIHSLQLISGFATIKLESFSMNFIIQFSRSHMKTSNNSGKLKPGFSEILDFYFQNQEKLILRFSEIIADNFTTLIEKVTEI